MLIRPIRTMLAALLLFGLPAAVPAAQERGAGGIAGEIRDEQGQPLAGASIVVRSQDAGFRRETQTDDAGRFLHSGLRPGGYHLLVLRQGEILWWAPFTLSSGQQLQADVDLQKLREAARERMTLSAELEQRRDADRRKAERESELRSHYNTGVRYLQEDAPRKAVEEFQAALAMEPDRGSTYALLGSAYSAAGERGRARGAYEKALALEPREAAHHNNLGTLLAAEGRLEEALEHFRRAAQLDSTREATYQFNAGAALLNAGRAQEALTLLRQATRTDPTLAVAHYFLGLTLLQMAPPPSAANEQEQYDAPSGTIEAFQRYLQLEPDGEYAEDARGHLERLGAPATDMLLPAVPSPEDF